LLLSTSYFPPIWYFEKIFHSETLTLEAHEHFVKQTIRNRCHILSPNGIQSLIVPVVHQNRFSIPIKEIRISNEISWQQQHWRSLCAAYRRSAFFEFYQDDLAPFYERKKDFLFDFNLELMHFVIDKLKFKVEINLTTEFYPPGKINPDDGRKACDIGNSLSPEKDFEYPQVFGYKNGFVPGLSIVDLLFSMGPASANYLKKVTSDK
jgi:hypothetical protein